MRAVLEDMQSGKVGIYQVPEPELRRGGILVRTHYSAISAGTERNKVEQASKSLLGKALARPDLTRQVIEYARRNGLRAAYEKVQTRLQALSPLGYSCAGIVTAVGEGTTEFQVGDRVAGGGGGYANHAEVNWVPRNLAVRVPPSVSLQAACFTTIGAVAIHGLRQANIKFGETVVVIGAGLIGVLSAQLARAAGCRVVAIDLKPERAKKAVEMGAHLGLALSEPVDKIVHEFSRYGADAAIITTSTSSSEPVELASRMLRDRGRIVIVGEVGISMSRRDMYQKELSLTISRSYGPGRYDHSYEDEGHDYPIGYVRWTEKRNMEAFLDLLSSGSLDLAPLIQKLCPVEQAFEVYEELQSQELYTAVLEYPEHESVPSAEPVQTSRSTSLERKLRIGCIGAGGFACNHVFPYLKKDPRVTLVSVATASGVAAESARAKFGFSRTQTPSKLVSDPEVGAVFVLSRHESHARYITAALRHDKPVFVEKPLALNPGQLAEIQEIYRESAQRSRAPFVMVGFNRRFAPATTAVRDFFAGRQEPMLVHIRVNAGFLPREHWTQYGSEGGRIIGEMCHFVDWARFVIGQPVQSVTARALSDGCRYNRDNVVATLSFADSSVANVLYLANGDPAVAKEHYEVFCEGGIARIEDFRVVELSRNRKTRRRRSVQDRGHEGELRQTIACLTTGQSAPIPFGELVEITETMFRIEQTIRFASERGEQAQTLGRTSVPARVDEAEIVDS